MQKVKIWQERVVIPTYGVGKPEKNPVFIEKRVYQGSSGSVYPYPVIEKILDKKENKEYQAVYLENEFVKIMILPEIGGRVQMAFDKTKDRHFIYYNQVIKPALVGLTGPWISGGIEFNWPQHHRPTTFDPTDFALEEHEDGSATVWCSELERMFRTKGMAGFTLHPGKSYLEIKVKLYNGTPFPQTFLWWANPAVKVNDHYQSVFPPDVNAVFDHGKRAVSSFPIATGTYYKVDYSPGTDISRYKNIPVPTSYMAITSKYNFVGGYENDSKGGILHVANHHISPGKKQWTWGNGDFGHAWDRNLTDEDGPYIELMCGVYTDNQPDFSWIMPNEQREFVQYFMPYRDLGVIKNATKDAMVNLEIAENTITVKVYTTGIYPGCSIVVLSENDVILTDRYDASPSHSYCKKIELTREVSPESLLVKVSDRNGRKLVSWRWEGPNEDKIPEHAKPAKAPEDIENNEQLFLTGLHLEQYRHVTFNALDYYNEALRRDSGDVRCNNAIGLWLLKRAKFDEAEKHFRKSIETLTERNPNPYDGESYFNLGLTLKYQDKIENAYNAFYKSTWNASWQNPAYFHLAQIDAIKGDWGTALNHLNKSVSRNANDQKALHLKIAVLRMLERKDEALALTVKTIAGDPFNFGALYEKYLITGDHGALATFDELIRKNLHNYIEYALDYASAGFYDDAIGLLQRGIDISSAPFALSWYYLGWFYLKKGNEVEAAQKFLKGFSERPDYCFPNQIESVVALEKSIEKNPFDAKAYYYLGNFWYNAKQYFQAIKCWEASVKMDDSFPTAFRNLSLGYFNKLGKEKEAIQFLEKAFSLDQNDGRVLMELDQLYNRLNKEPIFRLNFLEKNIDLVFQRDDIYLERIALYNVLGQHDDALKLIDARKFHPWEGGEGKVISQYILSLVGLAKQAIQDKFYMTAIDYLNRALSYPENLGEGKLHGTQENDIYFWLGVAHDKLDRLEEASLYWSTASKGLDTPAAAMFYNDQHPDQIFYQGLALCKLNKTEAAENLFEKLVEYGKTHLNDHVKIDYFAVSLPDLMIWENDLNQLNTIHCKYLTGLGLLGLGKSAKAMREFEEVLALEKCHLGCITHKKLAESNMLDEILIRKIGS